MGQIYKGNQLIIDSGGGVTPITVDDALSTTSENPVQNKVITEALNEKQDELTAGANITIAPTTNTISATDTTYTAGEGIEIKNGPDYSAMQGPCPTGYHVPSADENAALVSAMTALGIDTSNGNCMKTYMKMPFAGRRSNTNASLQNQGNRGDYWSCSAVSSCATDLYFTSSDLANVKTASKSSGYSVRAFKDAPVIPDNNWTTLFDGSSIATGAGIFHNTTDGLISISSDGQNWITIQDKNLGATTVYNDGDTLSETNCGYYYQRGNNYMFPFTGTVTTSRTQVDASNYGPGNYYSSNTFITITTGDSSGWSSVRNNNLWGGVTGVVTLNNAITNTGVLPNTTGTTTTVSAIWTGTEAEFASITPTSGVEYHVYPN